MPKKVGDMIILLLKFVKVLNNMSNRLLIICFFVFTYFIVNNDCFGRNFSDTTILYEQKFENVLVQKIYIEGNRNSPIYDSISSLTFFKKSPKKKNDKLSVNGKWIAIHLYKDNLYAYSPCDQGNNYFIQIQNDSLIEYLTEPNLLLIKSVRKEINNQTILTLKNEKGKNYIFKFYTLSNGIVLFEKIIEKEEPIYTLLVSDKKLKKYPIIINECYEKSDEFKFDIPNYKLLLNFIK